MSDTTSMTTLTLTGTVTSSGFGPSVGPSMPASTPEPSQSPPEIFTLTYGQNLTSYIAGASVSGVGNNNVFLGGSGQTFSGNGNASFVVNAASTVWTNGGTFSSEGISGSGNAVGLGASIDLVWDNGGGGNSIIPRAGDITLIGGPGIQSDNLNLSNILGATQWDGSSSTLSDYLHIVPTGAPEWTTAIGYSVTPNGPFQLAAFVEDMAPQQVATRVAVL